MKLRFRESQILFYADQYQYQAPVAEHELTTLKDLVVAQGFLTKQQLRLVAKWKSARRPDLIEKNSEDRVKEITTFALQAKDEKARIESLTILDGVDYPIASAILHFYHHDPYPILDFRALWSTSLNKKSAYYNFSYWWHYVELCRSLAKRNNISMRTLDRALWQYSKTNQIGL